MEEQKKDYIDLLAENLSNNISKEKEEQLNDWVDDSPDNKRLNEVLNRIEVSPDVSTFSKSVQDSVLSDVNRKIDRYSRKTLLYRISTIAACIAVILFFSVKVFIQPISDHEDKNILLSQLEIESSDIREVQIISGNDQRSINNEETITQTKDGDIIVGKEEKIQSSEIKTEYVTVVVPKGKRTTINFSDGSIASINSGTKLIYPKTFNKKTRDIYLDGEIYIEVAKNESKPFMVHTKNMEIKVLGTQFNVNAYNDEESHSVVLIEGSVMVDSNDKKDILQPNQGYFNEHGSSSIRKVDVHSYICWRDGILRINGETFETLLKKLSRYYGVKIIVAENVKDVKFEGSLNLRDSLDDVLRMLAISKPFKYKKIDDYIYIE